MSKVAINADTDTGELSVTVAGQQIPNVVSISIGSMPDYYGSSDETTLNVTICTFEEDEQSEVKRYSQIIAKNSEDGRRAVEEGAKSFKHDKSFVVLTKTNKVEEDIARFFDRFGV